MHYVIDGNNLIGHSPDLSLKDDHCRGEAMTRVAAFCRETGTRATIFFDGGPDAHVGENGVSLGAVRAMLAGKGVEADERILAMIDGAAGRRFTVVSSDRRIYGRARSAGIEALRIHEFNVLIGASNRRRRAADDRHAELEQKSRRLEEGEVQEWLEIFGEDA